MLLEAKIACRHWGNEEAEGLGRGVGRLIKTINLTHQGALEPCNNSDTFKNSLRFIAPIIPGSEPPCHHADERWPLGSLLITLMGFTASYPHNFKFSQSSLTRWETSSMSYQEKKEGREINLCWESINKQVLHYIFTYRIPLDSAYLPGSRKQYVHFPGLRAQRPPSPLPNS